MTESLSKNTERAVQFSIYSDSTRIRDNLGIVSVHVYRAVNRTGHCILKIDTGNMPPESKDNIFSPGRKISVEAGYGNEGEAIFRGLVTSYKLQVHEGNECILTIECSELISPITQEKQSNVSSSPVVKVTYGVNLISFEGELIAKDRQTKATTSGWNPTSQGMVKFNGHAGVIPGCVIQLDGLGKHFNENIYATYIEHDIQQGKWTTTVGMGLSPENISEPSVVAPAASGLLGLHEEMKHTFDEENKVITIETPGGNKIIISDKDKGITLTDQKGNIIKTNDSGITIESKGDLVLKAKNNIHMESGMATHVKAKTDLKSEAMNVEMKAKITLRMQGTASAELSASGQTTVKGAMVMIN